MSSAAAVVGLRRAARNLPLAAILWGVQLALAAIVALPIGIGLGDVVGERPAAASALLARPSIADVADLLRNADGLFSLLGPMILIAALLALLVNALLAGGVLEVLGATDGAPLGRRLGRGAGRFAGRMLRIGAQAAVAAFLLVLVGALPFALPAKRLSTNGHGIAGLWLGLGGVAAGGLLLLATLLALDLARVRLVREDRRDTLRLLVSSFRLVLRHPVRVFGAWLTLALALAALFALYALCASALPTSSMAAILALALIQQLVAFGRASLRVALWSAEIEIVEALDPRPAPAEDR